VTQSREILIQLYLEGTLSGEAQKEFDNLFREDPEFTRQAVEALEGKLGAAPESWVEETATHLDAKVASFWKAHELEKAWSLLRKVQWAFLAVLLGGVCLGWGWIKFREAEHLKGATTLGSTQGSGPKVLVSKGGGPRSTAEHLEENSGQGENIASESLPPAFRPLPEGTDFSGAEGKGPEQPQASKVKAGSGKGASSLEVSSFQAAGNKVQVVMDDLETGHVKIKVINSGGSLVKVLYEGSWEPDQHVYWNGVDQDGRKTPKGDYFIVVQTATKMISRKVSIR
jgi:hypothetical protein